MNVVGTNAMVMLPEVDLEEWDHIYEVNGGSIVNIGSVAGDHRQLRHRLLLLEVGARGPLALGRLRLRRLEYPLQRHPARASSRPR
jgi:hypothetical protein